MSYQGGAMTLWLVRWTPDQNSGYKPWLGYCIVLILSGSLHQALVVQRVDNAIHRINHYPMDSIVCFANFYPLDSDLSCG